MHLRAIYILSVCMGLLVVSGQTDLRAQEIRGNIRSVYWMARISSRRHAGKTVF